MKKLINFLKKSMVIALLCLVINTHLTAIPSTGLTVMPIPNPCSTCGTPNPAPTTEDPMDYFDHN